MMRSFNPIVILLLAISVAACKSKDTAKPNEDADKPVIPVNFVGRCFNETSGVPYHSIFFFPEDGELILYSGVAGGIRLPVRETDRTATKLNFTFRWTEKDKASTTRTGSVEVKGEKWAFEFEELKSSTCRPSPAPDYKKFLPDVGIPAGEWTNPRERVALTIAVDMQAFRFRIKKKDTLHRYRIVDRDDNSVTVLSTFNVPNDTDSDLWFTSKFGLDEDTLTQELFEDQIRVRYKRATQEL